MVTFFKKIPEMDMAKNTTISGRITDINLVTSKIVTAEMTMANLRNISFSVVESQIFWVYTGGT